MKCIKNQSKTAKFQKRKNMGFGILRELVTPSEFYLLRIKFLKNRRLTLLLQLRHEDTKTQRQKVKNECVPVRGSSLRFDEKLRNRFAEFYLYGTSFHLICLIFGILYFVYR
jgi:hypothetical protein